MECVHCSRVQLGCRVLLLLKAYITGRLMGFLKQGNEAGKFDVCWKQPRMTQV